MKRYLNLNDFGGKIVLAIAILGIGIPALLWAISLALNALGIQWPALRFILLGALAGGGILFLGLLSLVIVEQIQDHLIYKMYINSRGKRIPSAQGWSECPFCGNRKIKDFENSCPICGRVLK